MKRLVDHDLEASVLGSILRGRGSKDHVISLLAPEDFDAPAHRAAFVAMQRITMARGRIDTRAVLAEAASAGASIAETLSRLVDTAASPANAEHYVGKLRSVAALRAVAGIDPKAIVAGADDGAAAIAALRQAIDDIDKRGTTRRLQTGMDLARSAQRRLDEAIDSGGALRGLSTGLHDMDRALGGLRAGGLYLLAARPGMGKTALALNVVTNVAVAQKKRALMFSLEMPGDELADRILASESRIDSVRIAGGFIEEGQWPRVARALGGLSDSGLLVDDRSSIPIAEIMATARAAHSDSPLSLVVVDYAQLARGSLRARAPREQEVAEIAEGLKAIAKDLLVPVVALAQLNRDVERREDKKPMLSDLRESGQLEQAADAVLMLYREGYYNKDADQHSTDVLIRKHRHGRSCDFKLRWTPEMVRFDSLMPEDR